MESNSPTSDEWRAITTFPKYEINRLGWIRIKKTGTVVTKNPRPEQVYTYVWLFSRGGGVHRRLISTLRNNAFPIK